MIMLRTLKTLLVVALVAFAALLAYGYARNHPEDMPWTPLDLAQPVGIFTRAKLVGLTGEGAQCQALLDRAGVDYNALPARQDGESCGYDDAVRLSTDGALDIGYAPAGLGTSCPVAAALALWEWHVVQPAALEHYGVPVERIDHFGSYSCRRLYGRSEGGWSEHSTANAVDIAGFRLADGRRVTIVGDWSGDTDDAAFLREVRDGACELYATVLSPDYNAAHRDHLHFDQAPRGGASWGVCR